MSKNKICKSILAFVACVGIVVALFFSIRAVENGLDSENRPQTGAEADRLLLEEDDIDVDTDSEEIYVVNENEYKMLHSVKTYLFMGTDASGSENEEGSAYKGSMADFLLLLVVDSQDNTFGLLPINRDTITDVSMLDDENEVVEYRPMQICCAHYYGTDKQKGCENTASVVSELLGGIPVDGYFALSMDQIQKLNHEVGGVEVVIDEDGAAIDDSFTAGETVVLTDEQAELYIRARMGVGDGENTSRMKRQKQYFTSLFAQIQKNSMQDSKYAVKLFDKMCQGATTNIKSGKIAKLAEKMNGYENLGTLELKGENKVGQALDDGEDHKEFYIDEASLEENLLTLYPLELISFDSAEDSFEDSTEE